MQDKKTVVDSASSVHSTPSSSASDHPPPVQLVSSSQDEKTDNEYDGYFPPIPEGKVVRNSTSGSYRRGSFADSVRSRHSAMSIRDIYGDDIDPDALDLQRQQTRETVMSGISKVRSNAYTDAPPTSAGNDNVMADGSEFVEVDPELVTWEGPDDPKHPRNWTKFKKWLMTAIVSLYTMVSPLSSSILSPAVPYIAKDIGMDKSIEQSLSVSIFILAWAICPLFVAPLSEVYGRQVVLNSSIVLLLVFNIACAVSKNTAELLVFRFLAGMAGAPPISVGAGTLADMFTDAERNTPLALYSLGPTLGPVIAPIIAGWIAQNLKWQWVFWVLSIMNGVIAVFGLIFFRESFSPILLKRKANKLRKQTGNKGLHTVFELSEESLARKLLKAISRPITMLLTHPIIFGLGLFMAFMYGFMYLMLVTFPALWTDEYNYSVGIAGTMYLGLGVGFVLSTAFWTPMTQRTYQKLVKKNNGVAMPEFRIALLVFVALIMGTGLIWYGWSAEVKMMWLMPVVGTGIFAFGLVPMFLCIQNYLIDMNPRYSASAVAAAAVFRSFFGFGFPLFGAAMYDRLGYGWANTLCGILAYILGIPFPLVIYFYGERVRKWVDARLEKRFG